MVISHLSLIIIIIIIILIITLTIIIIIKTIEIMYKYYLQFCIEDYKI
jgi:hypothetical protein